MYIIYTNLLATSCVSCSLAFACGRRAAKASQKMVAEQWFACRLVFLKLTSHLTSVGHAAGAPVTLRDKTSKSGNALPGDKKNTTRRHQPRRCASSGFHTHMLHHGGGASGARGVRQRALGCSVIWRKVHRILLQQRYAELCAKSSQDVGNSIGNRNKSAKIAKMMILSAQKMHMQQQRPR